jgi:ATP-dependent Clp protease ATP-binding subunit ClpC
VFDRFSQAARRSIVLAHDAAGARGDGRLGTEHLLLGLIREGSAATALSALDVSPEAVLQAVEAQIAPAAAPDEPAPAPEPIPFTRRAKEVLERAFRETLQMGWQEVGPEHLLLALAEDDEGIAAGVLRDVGVTGTSVMRLLLGRTERPTEPEEGWEGPACPSCGAEVAVTAVHRRITVPAEQEREVRQIDVVFCGRCSRTLGVLPIA